jgi:hypothetical protein
MSKDNNSLIIFNILKETILTNTDISNKEISNTLK